MKKAVAYLRVSTEGQVDDFGLESQRKMCLDYAQKNGYEIVQYYEEVMSGAKDDEHRPVFNALVYGEIDCDCIIVAKTDRVARNTKLYFYYLYLLEKKGVQLLSTQESFDDENSGFANVYRSLLQFVAEQELKNITLRTSAGREIKASKGGYSGGKAPYGYSIQNGNLVINEEEAYIVRYIFELKDECGHGLNAIARILTDRKFPKRNGTCFWSAMAIKNIIDNRPTYCGYYSYGGREWVKGQHTPLLECEFDLVKWNAEKNLKNKKDN